MRTPAILIIGVLWSCFNDQSRASSQETTSVGVARIDITPSEPIRLSGYESRKTRSVGIETPLSARALAIGSDEQGPAIVVSADTLAIPSAISDEVASRIRKEFRIPRERIAFCATHTHSAPCVSGVVPNIFAAALPEADQAAIRRYTRELTDKLEAAIAQALRDRKPAKLAWSKGSLPFAVNRRLLKNGRWTGFGEVPEGPVDHDLPILTATAADGSILAVLFEYACHCTTLDPKDNTICADWIGYARDEIEKNHRGALAIGLIGCGGDSNPKGRPSLKVAQRHGRALADEAERIFRKPSNALSGRIDCRLKRIELPLDILPTRAELETTAKKKDAAGYNARTQLARLDRGEPLPNKVDYIVQTWSFGDRLLMVFLAGEVVVDYSIRLKREWDSERLWVVAYANDVPCYIASERVLREGGYEGGDSMAYYAKPTRLAPGVERRIIDAVRSITPEEFISRK